MRFLAVWALEWALYETTVRCSESGVSQQFHSFARLINNTADFEVLNEGLFWLVTKVTVAACGTISVTQRVRASS
jgi:hypothetical protein